MPEQRTFLSESEISIAAPVLAARIDMILSAELSPLGFERIRPRHWVDSTRPPIRRIFEFQPLKGDRYSARWGLSINFVPTQRNGKLAWKRTAKTARFDLCIDPIDREGRVEWCSMSRFIFALTTYDWGKVTRAVLNGVKAAHSDFARVASPRNIVEILEEISDEISSIFFGELCPNAHCMGLVPCFARRMGGGRNASAKILRRIFSRSKRSNSPRSRASSDKRGSVSKMI
jgi:hypothetical protein